MRTVGAHRLIGALHNHATAQGSISQHHVTLSGVESEPEVFKLLIPTPVDYAAHVATFELTQQKPNRLKPGGIGIRDAAWDVANKDRAKILIFAQGFCDENPSRAHEILSKLGMLPKDRTPRALPDYDVVQGPVFGSATAIVKSPGPRYAVLHRCTADGGKTFAAEGVALEPRFDLLGLTPGVLYQFQHRIVLPNSQGSWGAFVSFMPR